MTSDDRLDIILRAVFRVYSFHPDVPMEKFKRETNACMDCIKSMSPCHIHRMKRVSVESETQNLKNSYPDKVKEILGEALIQTGIEIPNEYRS